MKKSILIMTTVAALAAPIVSIAAPTVYGNIHISLNQASNDVAGAENNLTLSSNTSALGVKGSEDLGNGVKAIYKVEFQVNLLEPATTLPSYDPNNPNNSAPREGQGDLEGRDQFAGIKFNIGTLKAGTMSTNYKQTGKKVDPLYRTPLEARGFLNTQSAALHDSRRGMNRGRQTNTLQYVSPNMSGVRVVANTTFSGSNNETTGIGMRWQNKTWLVYADWIDSQTGDATKEGQSVATCDTATNCSVESAYKFGGSYGDKDYFVSLQYEAAENRTGGNYLFGSTYYNFNKNNQIILTAGQYKVKDSATVSGSKGYALAYNHKMSKLANLYFGYGAKSADKDLSSALNNSGDESMFTMGVRKKF